ncbi:hypothetical protein UK23_21750 [Lentzea aerocolonigenes]|uniref:Amino acid permease/ SLC12A domain-containing protein n=1 Tax=Lentzea aerocolonigenes TaxID=68170 RepID=A0A0F0GWP9_LENAE|nr:hypothetical protein UK23_21750 [Lentzea aerocolonigenes]
MVLDVIVPTTVLSCLSSGLHTASRMAFSLSGRGDAPRSWGRVSASGVPRTAVPASTVVGSGHDRAHYAVPGVVFGFLLNTSAAIALFVWITIAASHLRMRLTLEHDEPERLALRKSLVLTAGTSPRGAGTLGQAVSTRTQRVCRSLDPAWPVGARVRWRRLLGWKGRTPRVHPRDER